MKRERGFTLLELMVVVVIVGILASVAYPGYQEHILKARRAAAKGCLMELAQYMERYYTTNMKYTGAVLPDTSCRADLEDFYSFGFSSPPSPSPGATAFSIKAVPLGSQTRDTACGTLSLEQTGERTISGTGTMDKCW